ncbi:hypothetical protein L6164_001947 [Bauhinia variegata]|uniref:Uncharacterized protein n=1 Tax=Bauhinia variegata TaxID=167791 RepID=A0ACB9QDP0_BAUVA|nr:hypothetical protein L6164_001947 [Bauhinia variegata]
MKLSFSIQSKSSSKSNPNPIRSSDNFDDSGNNRNKDGTAKEYLSEFDASKTLTDPNKSAKSVIPPIQNEWRPHKRMKNLELPITESNGSTELGFELDTSSAANEPGSEMSYGLNLRQTTKDKSSNGNIDNDNDNEGPRPVPVETALLQKFKDDLKRLPDDQGFDEFEDVPVEGFGAALLAGYGWYEGRGIGKNAKEDVKVVQYERRTAKEGLGFVSDHARMSSSKQMERPKKHSGDVYSAGKTVRIVGGRDAGLKGKIVQILKGDQVIIKLGTSGEKVNVLIDDIAELGSPEEERCLKKLKELKIQSADKNKDSNNKGRRDERGTSRGEVDLRPMVIKGDSRKEEHGKKQISWLTSHIRVRIISKDFKRGRLHLKKGKVLDVIGPTTCDIVMDENQEIIQGVSQDLLETVIPRRGGPVLVLYGKHKGVFGSLVERDMDREVGVVKDADTQALHNVRFGQIAEFVGDPSILGY